MLDEARRGTLPGLVRTGATFADAAEFLRYAETDRGCKASTLRDCHSTIEAHLLPAFDTMAVEEVTAPVIERSRDSLSGMSYRTKNKLLVALGGVMRRAQKMWSLPSNPVAMFEKSRQRSSGHEPHPHTAAGERLRLPQGLDARQCLVTEDWSAVPNSRHGTIADARGPAHVPLVMPHRQRPVLGQS